VYIFVFFTVRRCLFLLRRSTVNLIVSLAVLLTVLTHLIFCFMLPPVISRRRHSAFGLSVGESTCVRDHYTKSSLAQYLTNRLWKVHHIYNLGAVGYKDKL